MIVKDIVELSVKDAVAIRFKELCDQQGIRPNELAVRSGVTHLLFIVCLTRPGIVFLLGQSRSSVMVSESPLDISSPALYLMSLSRRFNRSTYTPLIRFR